jgi:hypothetical protein
MVLLAEMRTWISYLIFVPGRCRAALLVHWGCHTDWLHVGDFWVWSPLVVDGALLGLDGKDVEAPSMPRIISDVGSERPLRPPLWHETSRCRINHLTLLVFNIFWMEILLPWC